MKRLFSILLVVLMLVAAVGAVSAQDLPGAAPEGQNPSNAIGIDTGYLFWGLTTGGFGIGGSYEFGLSDNFSAKIGGGYLSTFFGIVSIFDVYGQARYYIWPVALNGLYVGAGAGASIVSVSWNGTNDFDDGFNDDDDTDDSDTTVLPAFNAEVGYKFTLANEGQGGFFLEPNIGIQQSIGGLAGALGGPFRFGVGLGWTF